MKRRFFLSSWEKGALCKCHTYSKFREDAFSRQIVAGFGRECRARYAKYDILLPVFHDRGNDNTSAEDTEARFEMEQGQTCFSDKRHVQRSPEPCQSGRGAIVRGRW